MHPFVYFLTSYYHIREQQDAFGPQLRLPGCLATVFSQPCPDEPLHFHIMCLTNRVETVNFLFVSEGYTRSCYTIDYYETLCFPRVHTKGFQVSFKY